MVKCSQKMKKQLNQLKKDMNHTESTEILLAISLASDEMMHAVHMFPEVFYGDVTGNTNRHKIDLFLMVVKMQTVKPLLVTPHSFHLSNAGYP